MKKNFKSNAQGGFTLIELIVVIVILGILAATALPKFLDMGADARTASAQAAKGALSSAVAMVHGKSLLQSAGADVVLEDVTVKVTNNGYPLASSIAAAAGLSADDYDVTVTNAGPTSAASRGFSPKNAKVKEECMATYSEGSSTITVVTTGC